MTADTSGPAAGGGVATGVGQIARLLQGPGRLRRPGGSGRGRLARGAASASAALAEAAAAAAAAGAVLSALAAPVSAELGLSLLVSLRIIAR
jgi:hypothetical protein